MNYTFVPKAEAPAQMQGRQKRRLAGADELIGGLAPGQVARVELGEGERVRPVMEHLFKSAARQGRFIDIWEVGGLLYVELLVPGADADHVQTAETTNA